MVFFNYSTMQMAAKIVYYGPGLCGKTTNLHYIYSHTSGDSRGEMVSLETETDRTLFFDLLPIDVGSIAGFNTRIQLYTVPGQVFYNTTRKLVLKGVDGVVFVADSQRPMLQANLESLKNLEENLGEMGLSLTRLPIVLQFNKRDLAEICSIEELNQTLNPNGWPHVDASALDGRGVFETLKLVSKLTLVSLKQRLSKGGAATPPPKVEKPVPARPPSPAAPPARPMPRERPAAPAASHVQAPPAKATPQRPQSAAASRKQLDVLQELEKLRAEAMRSPAPARAKAARNGHGELFRDIQLTLKRADFERAKRFSLSLQVEDDNRKIVDAIRDLEVEIDDVSTLEKISLRLNIALNAKE